MAAEIPAAQDGEFRGEADNRKTEKSEPIAEAESGERTPEGPKGKEAAKRKRKRDCFEWTGLVINIVLCIATIAAAAFAFWLAHLTRIAIDNAGEDSRRQRLIAIDTEHRQFRAYVGVTAGDEGGKSSFAPPAQTVVRFGMHNFGATPANNVTYHAAIAVRPYPLAKDFDWTTPSPADPQDRKNPFTLLAPPGHWVSWYAKGSRLRPKKSKA